MQRLLRVMTVLALLSLPVSASAVVYTVLGTDQRPRYENGMTISAQSYVVRGITVATDQANSDTIDFQFHRQMMVRRASGTTTTLTVYVEGETDGSNFEIINGESGSQIGGTITISGTGWYVIDDEIFPAGAVRFQGNTAGTIDVVMKG